MQKQKYKKGELIIIETRLLMKGAIDMGGHSENVYMFMSENPDGNSEVYKLSTGELKMFNLDQDIRVVSHRPYDDKK
jgi:hypothetical protein